jgi:hypothetical protein
VTDSSRAAYAASAAELSRRTLDALTGVGGAAVAAAHVEAAADRTAALAALRVVGADTFAPHLLAGAPLTDADAAAFDHCFALFPPAAEHAPPPPAGPEAPWVIGWRDWATATLRALLPGGAAAAAVPRPQPAGASPDADWNRWSVLMGQLCSLALPGLDGPVHAAARNAPLALARGATRAVLRRDYPTAARIARWLAWLRFDGAEPFAGDSRTGSGAARDNGGRDNGGRDNSGREKGGRERSGREGGARESQAWESGRIGPAREPLPLDPATLVEHLALTGGGEPRLALDTAIARLLLAAPRDAYDPRRTRRGA